MKLSKELFKDVVAYIIGEPGAMGVGGEIKCLKASGESFMFSYLGKETNWESVKENFEGINGCKFNGPHRNSYYSANVVALGGDNDIATTIKEGWREICFDSGHHFVCKEEYACGFINFFKGMKSYEIICLGMGRIKEENFTDRLDSIADEYYEQKIKDEELTRKLKELNEDPEYIAKMSSCDRSRGVDAMIEVLKEFGLEISFMELKQYVFRQQGLYYRNKKESINEG